VKPGTKVITYADLLEFMQDRKRHAHAEGRITSDELWSWEHATCGPDPDKPGSVLFSLPLPRWTTSAEFGFVL
jgi:hypothetical protein